MSYSQDSIELRNQIQKSFAEEQLIGKELNELVEQLSSYDTEVAWADEPPGKLNGLFFFINDQLYIEVELVDIPKKSQLNMERTWEIDEVKSSKVHSIKIFYNNKLFEELK